LYIAVFVSVSYSARSQSSCWPGYLWTTIIQSMLSLLVLY